ncbi:MAG: UDP-N-acetylglucosamine 2-epimerase (hydrolyzing) [Phycisphaerales bacterium]|nr:MAG: UDP-N-acetylglucosamine 2-epimerase (hydrolyzing) [Phycisphaerales bacterium]
MSARGIRAGLRNVAVITGTRAEYGLLRSTMEAIRRHKKLRLQTVVTGMHLLRKFGHTIDDITKDGFVVDARVRMQTGDDSPLDQAIGLSRGIKGISEFVEAADSDIILVLGDRIEAMAGALAAVTTGRSLAHVHGGDIAQGDFDESLRHAITKLAHVHLTASRQSAQRVIRMGESPQRVYVTGAPGLDRILEIARGMPRRNGRSGRALVLFHAMGRPVAVEQRSMRAVLRAVGDSGLEPTVLYPNSDRGHTGVIQAIEDWHPRTPNKGIRVERSMARDDYIRALIEADVLVGNSSSGLIEAGTAGTPAVNVGPRQAGRQPSGPSVVPCSETVEAISAAIAQALRKRPRIGQPGVYGDGRAGRYIAAILAKIPLQDAFRRKSPQYRCHFRKVPI